MTSTLAHSAEGHTTAAELPAASRSLALGWLWLAVYSLVAAGLMAVLLAL